MMRNARNGFEPRRLRGFLPSGGETRHEFSCQINDTLDLLTMLLADGSTRCDRSELQGIDASECRLGAHGGSATQVPVIRKTFAFEGSKPSQAYPLLKLRS